MKLLKGRTPNIWNEEWEVGSIDENTGMNISSRVRIRSKSYIPCYENTTYYGHSELTSWWVVIFYNSNKEFISSVWPNWNTSFTTPQGARYMRFHTADGAMGQNHNISINYPSTDHNYHPYKALIKSGGYLNKIEPKEIITIGNRCTNPSECFAELNRLIQGEYVGVMLVDRPTERYQLVTYNTLASENFRGTRSEDSSGGYDNLTNWNSNVIYLYMNIGTHYEVIR